MPELSMVHVDQALTNLAIEFTDPAFVADRVYVPVTVSKSTDKYFTRGSESFLDEDDKRGPGAVADEVEWSLSNDSYYCEGHARRTFIPDALRAQADVGVDLDRSSTNLVMAKILRRKEKALAAAIAAATGSMAGTSALSGTSMWDNALSTPIKNIRDAKEAVRAKIGQEPRSILIGPAVWNILQDHAQIVDRIKYSQLGVTTEQLLARLFDVDEVIIPKSVEFSGTAFTVAGTAFTDIWGKNVLVFAKQAPSLQYMGLGLQFRWNYNAAGNQGVRVRRYRDEEREGEYIEAEEYYDLKAINWLCAYMYTTVVT